MRWPNWGNPCGLRAVWFTVRDEANAKPAVVGGAEPAKKVGVGDGLARADGAERPAPGASPVVREHTKLERVVSTSSLIVVSLVVLLILLLVARAVLTGTRTGLGLHRRNTPRPNRKVKSPVSAWEEAGRRLKVEPRGGEDGGEDGGENGGENGDGGGWRDGPPGDGNGDGNGDGGGGIGGPDDGEQWRTGRNSDVTGDDLPPERRTK